MSIRLRLSLFYSSVLALTLVIVGVVLYLTQSQITMNWLKQDLVVSSETLSQSILRNDLIPAIPGAGQRSPSPPPPLSLSSNQIFQRQSEREIVRVLDQDGGLVVSPFGGTEETLPLSSAALTALRDKNDQWEINTVSGSRLLIYSHPIIFQDRVVYILQVARSLDERDQSLRALGSTLIVTMLAAILVAFGIGWVLAGLTLQPILRISQTAGEIGHARDFTRRVAYAGPQDEVGQLAVTFNAMLSQLQDAYQKIAHTLEMQRSFVADVSHELRTPLTTLRGNLGLLSHAHGLSPDDQADVLKDMEDESDRLIRLVNDLLVMARADARQNLLLEPLALRPLMEEACRQAQILAPERSITLDISRDETITGDRDAVKQILIILLDNALKHSAGAIFLSMEIELSHVMISVRDEGEGIPPDKLEHVFDRFYRAVDRASTPGLGLGLPIAKALVEAQGGTIVLKSDLGKGTTITLRLPKSAA